MITLHRSDIDKIYDEFDRRINIDIEDGTLPNDPRFIDIERKSRAQGLYGTIMALVPNENWQHIVWWIDEVEEQRYGKRLWE